MIWIDSSFAIEWLTGTERAKSISFPKETRAILPMQYAEVFVFFIKRSVNPVALANELEGLELQHPDRVHLQKASLLYCQARKDPSCKASLADAILAAVALERREKILSFDHDFVSLGLRGDQGLWQVL